MKQFKKLGVVAIGLCFLVAGVVLLGKNIVWAKSNEYSNDEIQWSKKGKIYSFNLSEKVERSISDKDGILSSNKQFIAYTINIAPYKTDPFLYIENIKTGEIEKYPLDIDYIFSPQSWSPNDRYIVINQNSQYVGGMKSYIWDRDAKKIIKEFSISSESNLWEGENLYLFEYIDTCESGNCLPYSTLTIFDLNKKDKVKLKEYELKKSLDLTLVKADISSIIMLNKNTVEVFNKKENSINSFDIKEKNSIFINYLDMLDKITKNYPGCSVIKITELKQDIQILTQCKFDRTIFKYSKIDGKLEYLDTGISNIY